MVEVIVRNEKTSDGHAFETTAGCGKYDQGI